MPILKSGTCAGAAGANSHRSTRPAGNHVTASVRVTSRTVPPLWSLTFSPRTRSLYCLRTSFEIFARALTASRAAVSRSGNFVPSWSQLFSSPSAKSKKYNGIKSHPPANPLHESEILSASSANLRLNHADKNNPSIYVELSKSVTLPIVAPGSL
jgi:hypothetical protein